MTARTRMDRAARLQHAMHERGVLSINELDRQAGVGSGWTSRFLDAKKLRPGPETIQKVCVALRIHEQWLLYGTGPRDIEDGEIIAPPTVEPLSLKKATRRVPSTSTMPINGFSFHPDIEALVRLARNRKTWSLPALALADEMIREQQVAPEELESLLDRLQIELQRVKGAHLKPG